MPCFLISIKLLLGKKKIQGGKTGENGSDTWYPFCDDSHRLRIGIVALLHREVMPIIQ